MGDRRPTEATQEDIRPAVVVVITEGSASAPVSRTDRKCLLRHVREATPLLPDPVVPPEPDSVAAHQQEIQIAVVVVVDRLDLAHARAEGRKPERGLLEGPIITLDEESQVIGANDEVDPTIPADRMIHNQANLDVGVTVTRKIYAYVNQFHDNYHIIDHEFCNTGNIDDDEAIELDGQILNEVYFYFMHR